MVLRIILLLALISAIAIGCTTTMTFQLEVNRPLTVTIDGDDGDR